VESELGDQLSGEAADALESVDASMDSRFSVAFGWSIALLMLLVWMVSRWLVTSDSATPGPSQPPAYLVDINAASVSELRALPEIGPSLAQRIVERRAQLGEFRTLEDLEGVRGFGPKTLQSVRHQLCINPGSFEPESVAAR
jgi:competence ComEA-like helix-hairpin-helix protein